MLDLFILPVSLLVSWAVVKLVVGASEPDKAMAVYQWPDGARVQRSRLGDLEREGVEAMDFILPDPEHDLVLSYLDPTGWAMAHLHFMQAKGGLLLLGMRGPVDGSLDSEVEARFTAFLASLSSLVPLVNTPGRRPKPVPLEQVPVGTWLITPAQLAA